MRRVLAFYKFINVADPEAMSTLLDRTGRQLNLKGTILLAHEGINGTIVADENDLIVFQALLLEHFGQLPYKWSELDESNGGFNRYKVRIKPEIVTFGVPELDVHETGQHVSADRWNQLLNDPEVVVIDTRNTYEVDIGTFPTAVSPDTTNFREFPAWASEHLDPNKQPKVAMFCTGGIRCEKASAYMLAEGFQEVYQLDGGILRYLEQVEPEDNRWQGECFVFDQRVSVDANLEQGQYQQCFACRHPLSADELLAEEFEQGVSCPHCFEAKNPRRIQGLRERQRQIKLSKERGEQHIGKQQRKKEQAK